SLTIPLRARKQSARERCLPNSAVVARCQSARTQPGKALGCTWKRLLPVPTAKSFFVNHSTVTTLSPLGKVLGKSCSAAVARRFSSRSTETKQLYLNTHEQSSAIWR